MTSAAASADGPSDRVTLLAHYPLQVCVAVIALDFGWHTVESPSALRVVLYFATFLLYFFWIYAMAAHHKQGLCERCAKDTPLDPEKAVAKRIRWLRLTHRFADTRWRWLPLGVAIGSLAVGFIQIGSFSFSHITSPIFWVAMLGPAILAHVHNPLQPWCPFCRWDDGGDSEPSPEPTPDPSIAPDRVS